VTASRWTRLALVLLAAASPAPATAPAPKKQEAAQKQAVSNKLKATERARAAHLAQEQSAQKQAAAAAARAAALAAKRVAAAEKLRAIETKVDSAAALVQQAATEQAQAQQDVEQRTADISAMLPMALRLSLYPTETVLAAPAAPDKALEGLLATHGLSTELARQVAELRVKQAEAAKLRQAVLRRQAALQTERAHQTQAAQALDQEIDQAAAQQDEARDEAADAAQAAAVLAAKADDLRSAIAAMDEAERQAAARAAEDEERARVAKQTKLADAARAREAVLSRPAGPGLKEGPATVKATLVAGRIVRAWGAPAEDGPATGITFGVAPAAFVSSPCTGRVAFAQPFRSYGKLMIIDCGGGYNFVLAGFDQMNAGVGHVVARGEPVGRMADYDPATAKDRPALYVELRKKGQPVNPMPFLNGKV